MTAECSVNLEAALRLISCLTQVDFPALCPLCLSTYCLFAPTVHLRPPSQERVPYYQDQLRMF